MKKLIKPDTETKEITLQLPARLTELIESTSKAAGVSESELVTTLIFGLMTTSDISDTQWN